MDTPHPIALILKNFPEVIIPDHNIQAKLKAQASFVRKNGVLCYSLYLYLDEVRSDDLMKEFTKKLELIPMGECFKFLMCKKISFNIGLNMIQQKQLKIDLIFVIYVHNSIISHPRKRF